MRGQALAFAFTMLNCWFYVIRRFQHRTFALLLVLAAAVSLCAQNDAAARVISLSGQVSILRDGSTWALNAGDFVKPRQTIVTGADSYATFKVSDGSTFDVFPNAQVIFRNNPGDWKDLLEITLGKVKVQIQHFGGQPNHNKVRTPTAVIAVRGTVFDVDVEDADATTLVLVEEGQVEVRHLLTPGQTRFLNPGEFVRVFKNQPLAARTVDRGMVMQRLFRAASDALNEALYRLPRGTPGTATGTTGTTTTSSGDKTGPPPPTTNPAPPAPPH